MNPRYSRWLLRLAVVLILGLLGLFWAVSHRTSSLSIENQSQQSIVKVHITIGGQTQSFHDVKPGARLTAEGPARSGDHFSVKGQLADTTLIAANGPVGDRLDFILLPNGHLQPRPKNSR